MGGVAAERQSGASIELVALVKDFGSERILDGVDLAVPPGAITVLLGASGAGKTVTINHVFGLLQPSSGVVRVEGKDLASLLLFGGFLAYAVYDRISVKRRAYAGRLGTETGSPVNDVIVVVLGLALYALIIVWGHGALIGVPLLNINAAP